MSDTAEKVRQRILWAIDEYGSPEARQCACRCARPENHPSRNPSAR